MAAWLEGEFGEEWIYVWPSPFLCSPETITTLLISYQFSSVQSLSHVWLFATPWIAAHQASLSTTNSRSSLRLTSMESVMPSSHVILCHPLLLLPPIPPSIRVFSNESTLHMRYTLIQNKTLKKQNLILAQQPMGELSTACDALHFPPSTDCFPLNKGQQACC